MPSVALQLSGLAVTDTLKHAATPSTLTKFPFVNGDGTWSEAAGWSPGSFEEGRSATRSGYYLNTEMLMGNLAVGIKKTTGSLSSLRSFSLWLYTPAGSALNGYELRVQQEAAGKVKYVLRRWDSGEFVILESAAGLTFAENDSFFLVRVDGTLQVYHRTGEETPTLVGEAEDSTFAQGFAGFGGNGSNPKLVNFIVAPLLPATPLDVAPKADLSVAIITASGDTYRWGPDEWDAKNIPQGIAFTTSMPGGFKTATINLPRRIDLDYPDLNLLDTVQILGPGNEVVWEGRVQQLPRSHGDTFSIQVGAVGWSAHLMDDTSFREIYVSRDLGEWAELSAAWRISWGSGLSYRGFSVAPDSGEGKPALAFEIDGVWTSVTPHAGALFDAGPGLTLASMYYDFSLSTSDSNFGLQPASADDDKPTNWTGGSDLATGSASGSGTFTPAVPRRVFSWEWFFPTGGGEDGVQYRAFVRRIAVFGNHGLTKRGAAPEEGYYASDVVADVVGRAAPLLRFTTGEGGSIQPTNFVIPHLVFREPTTAQAVVMHANGYHLWDWGVWEDREFFFREPDPDELTWEVRLSEGARLDLEGTQVGDVYNGVFVQYTDPAGIQRSVGPPGSGADVEDASLVDTSDANPVNAHGIPRKWALLSLSQTTTEAGAIQLGRIYLGEKSLPQRRGQLVLTGTATHPTAGKRPVWAMRAGHWARIADHPTDTPRKIIETSYDASTQTITCSLDNTSQKLDAILERLGVSLMGVL